MVQSVSFPIEHEVECCVNSGANYAYLYNLDSLRGKTFVFKPGVNVIVGPNGCGKTSLMNVIRTMTFCNDKLSSYYGKSRDDNGMMGVSRSLFSDIILKNDWHKSVFNLLKADQMDNTDGEVTMDRMMDKIYGKRRSEGQKVRDALNRVISMFKTPSENGEDVRDFDIRVKNRIEAEIKPVGSTGEEDIDPWRKRILEYFKENQVDSEDYTLILDEPDKGLDIRGIKRMRQLFDGGKFSYPIQLIGVLHNVALIRSLMKDERINFIEMTDGYLDEIRSFDI